MALPAPSAFADGVLQLKKPDWTECVVGGQTYGCLDVAQIQHYLELYVRYKEGRAKIALQEESLKLYQEWDSENRSNLANLLVQVHASNDLIRQLRDAPTPDSGVPVWEVFLYVVGGVLLGVGVGAAGGKLLSD